jgi:S-adenosylmethionine decarboxylase
MSGLKLQGFNHLAKSLSLSFYDVQWVASECLVGYRNDIAQRYGPERLSQILTAVTEMIGANILHLSTQKYEPQGTSVCLMVSEERPTDVIDVSGPGPAVADRVLAHLDKSHIAAHTYPEDSVVGGVHVCRLDVEVSSCGVVSPLKALNYLLHEISPSVLHADYRVQGFTRDVTGKKYFMDHDIERLSSFVATEIKSQYVYHDGQWPEERFFRLKMYRPVSEEYVFSGMDNMVQIQSRIQSELQEIFDC